ncbi:MAG: class I SAM-dependent methyltransferase [Actinomycetota bacterium]|nr:class I SAM-dependent methyltransferase [Actinomycetota bacterium]
MARPEFDPYLNDPERWGVSLAQMAELMLPCLDAIGARSVAEVGAYAGDLTRVLAGWAADSGARVLAIDPAPQPGLLALAQARPELELIGETSLAALPELPMPDALVIDGDHNYFTVSEELRLIGERAAGKHLPLLLFHDVCWPHGRRDDYFDAEQIPESYRHPVAGEAGGLFPGDPGIRPGGLPYPRSAAHEGGPRNGVLTAAEDFVAGREDLRLVVVPAFFGFGAVWPTAARWSDELARILDPFDRHPIIARLEASRVHHLALGHSRLGELWSAQKRLARQEEVLRRLLDSSAFAVAERLSRLRASAGVATEQSIVSKEEIRRALADGLPPGAGG